MNIVVAVCKNNGIGFKNRLPWTLKNEIKYFKNLTIGKGNNAVIMGKNTWLGFDRALPKRDNFVMSKNISHNIGAQDFKFIKTPLYLDFSKYDDVWVIGGQQIYESMLDYNTVNNIFITEIEEEFDCDTYFPDISKDFQHIYKSKTFEENNIKYSMNIYSPNRWKGVFYNKHKDTQINKCLSAINKL